MLIEALALLQGSVPQFVEDVGVDDPEGAWAAGCLDHALQTLNEHQARTEAPGYVHYCSCGECGEEGEADTIEAVALARRALD